MYQKQKIYIEMTANEYIIKNGGNRDIKIVFKGESVILNKNSEYKFEV